MLYIVFVNVRVIIGIPTIIYCGIKLWYSSVVIPSEFYGLYIALSCLLCILNLSWSWKMTLMALSTLGLIEKQNLKKKN